MQTKFYLKRIEGAIPLYCVYRDTVDHSGTFITRMSEWTHNHAAALAWLADWRKAARNVRAHKKKQNKNHQVAEAIYGKCVAD